MREANSFNKSGYHLFGGDSLAPLIARIKARDRLVETELANAVNKAARESINLSVDEWNSHQAIEDKTYIKNKIKITRAATPGKPTAVVVARDRAVRADNFRYRLQPGRKGVWLNVRRGSPGGVIDDAFVITAKSNNKPLIVRRLTPYKKGERRDFKHGGESKGRFNKADQLRFKALYGPSPTQHFFDSRQRVAPQAMSAAKQQFLKAVSYG